MLKKEKIEKKVREMTVKELIGEIANGGKQFGHNPLAVLFGAYPLCPSVLAQQVKVAGVFHSDAHVLNLDGRLGWRRFRGIRGSSFRLSFRGWYGGRG